jgi:hypothetical protein
MPKLTKEQKVVNGLQAVTSLLTKSKWGRNVYARNAKGEEVAATSKTACCFCTVGAIYHVAGKNEKLASQMEEALYQQIVVKEHNVTVGVLTYNDFVARDKREIIRMINRAIKNVETGKIVLSSW